MPALTTASGTSSPIARTAAGAAAQRHFDGVEAAGHESACQRHRVGRTVDDDDRFSLF